MSFFTELFLAWRYFKPKKSSVSVITVISIVGISLGVAVLMVVIAIMSGFTNEIKAKLLDITPHIQIESFDSQYIENPYKFIYKLRNLDIVSAVPVTEGEVLVQKGKKVLPQFLIGVDQYEEPKGNFIKRGIVSGRYDLSNNNMLVSYILSSNLDLFPGSRLIVHSPYKLSKMLKIGKNGKIELEKKGEVYLPSEFKIVGIFNMGMYDFDNSVIICNIDSADTLFGYPLGSATKIVIKVPNPFKIESIYNKIVKLFPEYRVLNWRQLNKQFLGVLAVEKNMMFFVLIFIVLVAASSITNTLITVITQKSREIGLLRAIGLTKGSIMRIFIFQGFISGIIGTVVGLIIGSVVIIFRMDILHFMSNVFGIELFPKQFYYLSTLPAAIVPGDLIFISMSTIILCTLGALIPAYRAAKLDPAKALRYE